MIPELQESDLGCEELLFKTWWDDLLAMNRPVYEAVLNTSRYAAFFRALKGANAEQWRKFIILVSTINVTEVETPNEIPKKMR
jgi:hypothetical protein